MMDFKAVIDVLRQQDPKPVLLDLHSQDPEVIAAQQYINWAIYNSPSAVTTLENIVTEAQKSYYDKVVYSATRNLQPPQEF